MIVTPFFLVLLIFSFFTYVYATQHEIVIKVGNEGSLFDRVLKQAESLGYRYSFNLNHNSEYHVFRKDTPFNEDLTNHWENSTDVQWSKIQSPLIRRKRGGFTPIQDPLYSSQWHLRLIYKSNPHLNVVPVWESGISGNGIVVSIVDDGVEIGHPDFENSFTMNKNLVDDNSDEHPTPYRNDYHGTSVAGIIGARANRMCGVGIAPKVSLSAIKLLGDYVTDAREAVALSFQCQRGIDIYSNSWGPTDDGRRHEGPGPLTKEAMAYCIKEGRKGKGSIYVWAGGNGRSNMDNANYDGYANSIYTITVAAVTDMGKFSWYSESGACILVTAPSSGGNHGIFTTDLMGMKGRTSEDCNMDFGGTSAAAPMISGIVALMLHANSKLTWRDVQEILIYSSNMIDSNNTDKYDRWTTNGAGFSHSHTYGFGIPDAARAVNLSRHWNPLPEKSIVTSSKLTKDDRESGSVRNYAITINPGSKAEIEYTFKNTTAVFGKCLEHVELEIRASTPQGRGELTISLLSPSQTNSFLQTRHLDEHRSLDWTYTSVRYWGENPTGKWKFYVTNVADKNTHVIKPVVLSFWKIILHLTQCH